jgi:hypothetical protein
MSPHDDWYHDETPLAADESERLSEELVGVS